MTTAGYQFPCRQVNVSLELLLAILVGHLIPHPSGKHDSRDRRFADRHANAVRKANGFVADVVKLVPGNKDRPVTEPKGQRDGDPQSILAGAKHQARSTTIRA